MGFLVGRIMRRGKQLVVMGVDAIDSFDVTLTPTVLNVPASVLLSRRRKWIEPVKRHFVGV